MKHCGLWKRKETNQNGKGKWQFLLGPSLVQSDEADQGVMLRCDASYREAKVIIFTLHVRAHQREADETQSTVAYFY